MCFLEDYDFRTKRGKISVFEINGNKYEELGTALDEPFHLSYPFIFTVDNELYMCPETAKSEKYGSISAPSFRFGGLFTRL